VCHNKYALFPDVRIAREVLWHVCLKENERGHRHSSLCRNLRVTVVVEGGIERGEAMENHLPACKVDFKLTLVMAVL
jgi:hypothetical protein